MSELSDEELIRACRDAGFSAKQWATLTYDRGPYLITMPTETLRRLAELLRRTKE